MIIVLKEERFLKLLQILQEAEFATVEELSRQLQVSLPTIRRDLSELVNRNLIIRSHGGAMCIPTEDTVTPMDFRKSINYRVKNKLAQEASRHIRNHTVIFIDASTTTAGLSEYLKGRQDLIVITNSLMTAVHLKNLGLRTYCLGGEVIGNSSAVGGTLAIGVASSFNIDLVFFSSVGINDQGMMVDTSEEETALRQFLLKRCTSSFFLCDSTKFGRSAAYNIAPLSDVDYVITDAPLPPQYPSPKKGVLIP